jgi:hypothetical protein
MIVQNGGIYIGKHTSDASLLLKHANRHGLVAGATGTGSSAGRQIARGILGALLK